MDQEILEKLKKLLRLGQSSNQHEAALALERAFELAARHNIDLANVDVDEETRRILHKQFGIGKRLSLVRKLALGVVNTFFNVNAIIARPDIIFVGTETDVEIAQYVFSFLTWACSKALSDYRKDQPRKLSANRQRNFVAGYMYAVANKLDGLKAKLEIEDARSALVLHAKASRDKYEGQNFTTKPEQAPQIGRRNRDALLDGHVEGRKLEINKGLGGKPIERLLLTA